MSGCSSGMAGSMFCDSCHNYSCASNPNYYGFEPSSYEDTRVSEDFYKKNNLEHLKGTAAPNIPIVDIEEETKRQVRAIWNNF